MSNVVAIDCTRGLSSLFDCREGQQSLAAWQQITAARVLREHRPSAGEIADTSVAEPAAAGLHVHPFRDHDFGRRTADVVAVPPGVARDQPRLDQGPSVAAQEIDVLHVCWMDVQRHFEATGRETGQRREFTEFMDTETVSRPLMRNRTISATPGRH